MKALKVEEKRVINLIVKNNSIAAMLAAVEETYDDGLWQHPVSQFMEFIIETQLVSMSLEWDTLSYTKNPSNGEDLFVLIKFPDWELSWNTERGWHKSA